jgi:hypothetical protein
MKILGTHHGVNQILFGLEDKNSLIEFWMPVLFFIMFTLKNCVFHICAKFQKKSKNTAVIITGAKIESRFIFFGLKNLSKSEFKTTETELIAIASPANSGLSTNHREAKAQAAIGIPRTL